MRTLEIKGAHSGHTLLAAILDCHPNVIVANRYGKPITKKEILSSYDNNLKWIGVKYSFKHHSQFLYKSDILWLGNTGAVENPDNVVAIVRNPFVMAFSLIKRYKTKEAVTKLLFDLFKTMTGEIFFYEDLVGSPVQVCNDLACYLKLQIPDYWLDAALSLIRRDIPQPRLEDIDFSQLFDTYEWLGRYK